MLLPLLLAGAVLAGPAGAEDLYSVDARLEEAGYDQAYTDVHDSAAGDGYRVVLDFDGDSGDRAEYEEQARGAAELLWDSLQGRLLAVDVVPTHDVGWVEDGLPPALSYTRADLETAFGPRLAGLDEGDVHGEEVEDLALDGPALGGDLALAALVLVGLLLVGVLVVVVLLLRRPRRAAGAWDAGAWDAGAWDAGTWDAGTWGAARAPHPGAGQAWGQPAAGGPPTGTRSPAPAPPRGQDDPAGPSGDPWSAPPR